MFNLERAVQTWKSELRSNPAFEDGDIAELESHLRDEIDRLKTEGASDEEAFKKASGAIGDPESVGQELYKTRSVKPDATPPWRQSVWIASMLPNYLKTALRNIRRSKGYTLINVTGLAVGLAVFLFIVLFIRDEISYDQFHAKGDRIYRVTYKIESQGKEEHYAVAVPGLAPALTAGFPEVRQSVRISRPQDLTFRVEGESFAIGRYYHADSTFFRIFDFSLTKGNPATALSAPNTVVLSEETAQQLFGSRNPIGKIITAVYGTEYEVDLEVTGIVEEIPSTSHFKFNMLASFETLQELYPIVNDENWWMRTAYTYVELPEGYEAGQLERKLPNIVQQYMGDMQQRSGQTYSLKLQPLTEIHLYSHLQQELETNGDIRMIYILGSIAVLILIIACINYMNLATARATRRSKEIGVRKALGASRRQLARQFYLESFIIVFLAVLSAMLTMISVFPLYNQLAGKELSIEALFAPEVLLVWIAILLIVAVAAGSYPAVMLSSFQSTKALKGVVKKGVADIFIRKGLVIFQFTVSAALLIGILVIQNQLEYVKTKDLGFEKEQVLVIPINSSARDSYNPEAVKQELLQHSGIRQVAHASHIPTRMLSNNTMVIPEGTANDRPRSVTSSVISASLKETLDLEIKEGRNFSPGIVSDTAAFIINEAAIDYFEWSKPIGKSIKNPETGEEMGRVIGVYKNFHVQSLHQKIEPVLFSMTPVNRYSYVVLRLRPSSVSSAISYSEETWSELVSDTSFEYFFLDDQYQKLYEQEEQLSKLIGLCTLLAVVIACLGLVGLAAHSVEQRTKEVGIRKVLGASIANTIVLLSKDMVKLVLIGFTVAIPVAYLVIDEWLQQFAYQVGISWSDYVLGGLLTLLVALAAVSSQAVKAALMDPVKTLRSE